MGVTGLWRLIEPSGKPVPLETLENKVLAVDVSIWLHQALKGFHDSQGAVLPNAHLLGIYHRVCKLLYFKIKPIFVFDGGVPALKKETIWKRNQQKNRNVNEADRIHKQLLTTLLKHSAVSQVLSETARSNLIKQAKLNLKDNENDKDSIYKLPEPNRDTATSTDDESTSETGDSSPSKQWDLHTIDEQSVHFKSLPVDIRHEILTELKETRKQSSWGRLHELPKQRDDFATFQMKRLLKRYSVQVSLEEVQKEMGGCSMSLTELENLLKDQGVVLSNESAGSRIASDENTKYLLIKDVKKAMDEAKRQQELDDKTKIAVEEAATKEKEKFCEDVALTKGESEYDKDLETAIQLSLQEAPSTSKDFLTKSQISFMENFKDGDFQDSSESEEEVYDFSTARDYMIEYSGLSANEVNKIIGENAPKGNKTDSNTIKKNVMLREKQISEKQSKTTKNAEVVEKNETKIKSDATGENQRNKDEIQSRSNVQKNEDDKAKMSDSDKKSAVEIMSDSEDSDDFMEVSESNEKSSASKQLEILIKPDDILEDDLFGDVFSNARQSLSNVSEPMKEVQVIDSIKPAQIETSDVTKDIINSAQVEESNVSKETAVSNRVEIENKVDAVNSIQIPIVLEVVDNSSIINKSNNNIAQNSTEDLNITENVLKADSLITRESNVTVEKPKQILTTEQLQDIQSELIQETDDLVTAMNAKTRMASNLTEQIHQEAQELLQLFGVPYIVAPMEAEAQCAFLEYIDFTNGTITDDSDIWLFGGKTVYKNFFDQRKLVMEYRSENIQHNFKLSREQMILLALLVGSDYTTGLQGIGPVTALEILAAFPLQKSSQSEFSSDIISGLKEFRRWLEGRTQKGPKRVALRNKLKNIALIESFPSLQVVKAYLEPSIDNSKEPFSWAKPDIPGLIEFARKKFGWPHSKSENILEPVLKRLKEVTSQKSIKDYFRTKHIIDGEGAKSKMSKRVQTAVERIGQGDESVEEVENEPKKMRQTRKKAKLDDVELSAAGVSKSQEGELKKQKQKTKKRQMAVERIGQRDELVEDEPKKTRQPRKKAKLDDAELSAAGVSKSQESELKEQKQKTKKRHTRERPSDVKSIETASAGLSSDEDIQVLKSVCKQSKEKMEHFKSEIKKDLEQVTKKPRTTASFHKKDVIPQIESDKLVALRSKMKAIEVFRKSKKGPGYVKKRNLASRKPKEDAELSESSSSD